MPAPARRLLLICLLIVLTVSSSCSRNREAELLKPIVPVSVRVINNLSTGLELQVSSDSGVVWTGSVGPKTTSESPVGSIRQDTPLELVATNPAGTVVSRRRGILARAEPMVWMIP